MTSLGADFHSLTSKRFGTWLISEVTAGPVNFFSSDTAPMRRFSFLLFPSLFFFLLAGPLKKHLEASLDEKIG